MNLFKKIFDIFKQPEDFSGDVYGWMTNQIGHVSVSFLICYISGTWIPLLIFWLSWEIWQFIKSREENLQDLIEDLFFEIGGVMIFIYGDIPLYIVIGVFIIMLIKKI